MRQEYILTGQQIQGFNQNRDIKEKRSKESL